MQAKSITMGRFLIIKFSLWVAVTFVQMHAPKSCLDSERIGLLEIKAFIKSVSDMQYADAILVSWVDNRTSDCCTWERIKCNATTGRVMELSLGDAIRVNSVDASDGFPIINMSLFVPFQELHVLDLLDNRFEGWEENKGKIYESSLHALFG